VTLPSIECCSGCTTPLITPIQASTRNKHYRISIEVHLYEMSDYVRGSIQTNRIIPMGIPTILEMNGSMSRLDLAIEYAILLSVVLILVNFWGCSSQTEREYECAINGIDCERSNEHEESNETSEPTVPTTQRGPSGSTGPAGEVGPSGNDGVGCTVADIPGGLTITCGDTVSFLYNGSDGIDGLDGSPGEDGEDGIDGASGLFSDVEIVDPCGDHVTKDDEILIRLSSGQLLRSQSDASNGNNTRLVLADPDTYITRDGSNCTFTINPDYSISNEHY
jgi:hypothetical protein